MNTNNMKVSIPVKNQTRSTCVYVYVSKYACIKPYKDNNSCKAILKHTAYMRSKNDNKFVYPRLY